jgi:CHAP domain
MRRLTFRRHAGLAAVSALLLALVVPAGTGWSRALAQTCPGSCVTISPTQGPPATTVTATGSDWPAGDQIQAIWGSTSGPDVGSPVTVSGNGAFTLSFTVPTNATLGSTQVFFWDATDRYFEPASTPFVVTAPVAVTSVSTWGFYLLNLDTSNKAAEHATSQFTPGEQIEYVAYVRNTGTTAVTETFSYAVTGPSGSQVYSWSGPVSVSPGTNGYILPSDIPNASVSQQQDYTITVALSLNGSRASNKTTFTVLAGPQRTLGAVLAAGSPNPYNTTNGGFGQCTYGADQIFASYTTELYYPNGRYLPDFQGNASNWSDPLPEKDARYYGWTVSSTPQLNSIAVFKNGVNDTDATDGHVSWVTNISGSTITVDEMNGTGPSAGINKYDYYTYRQNTGTDISYILATDTSSNTWAQVAANANSRTNAVLKVAVRS